MRGGTTENDVESFHLLSPVKEITSLLESHPEKISPDILDPVFGKEILVEFRHELLKSEKEKRLTFRSDPVSDVDVFERTENVFDTVVVVDLFRDEELITGVFEE